MRIHQQIHHKKDIPPCPITVRLCKKLIFLLLVSSSHVLEGCNEVSSEPSLLQAKQVQLSQNDLLSR